MGIQDDIFDVKAALKRRPEAPAFERICAHFFDLEVEADARGKIIDGLRDGLQAVFAITATIPKSRRRP